MSEPLLLHEYGPSLLSQSIGAQASNPSSYSSARSFIDVKSDEDYDRWQAIADYVTRARDAEDQGDRLQSARLYGLAVSGLRRHATLNGSQIDCQSCGGTEDNTHFDEQNHAAPQAQHASEIVRLLATIRAGPMKPSDLTLLHHAIALLTKHAEQLVEVCCTPWLSSSALLIRLRSGRNRCRERPIESSRAFDGRWISWQPYSSWR